MQKRFYYGWVIVFVAAGAMAATLPGRTHGLGLITKPLLNDFPGLSQQSFAALNAWATLIGAAFCLPCGWLLDRCGLRNVLTGVLIALAATIFWLARLHDETQLAIALTLTRGIGQSMLSVVSITMVGKWFQKNLSLAMGVYAVLMSFLMAAATGIIGAVVINTDWRLAWTSLGWSLVAFVPLAWLLTRDRPAADTREPVAPQTLASAAEWGATWQQALASPCFWIFAGSISLFGMVSSGVSLFEQYILEARGLSAEVFVTSLVIGLLAGMVTSLIVGGLARVCRLQHLLAGAMLLLAGSLSMLPLLTQAWHAYAYAIVHGIAGGTLTVLFFAVWGQAFGLAHLGRIQGLAQMLTVFASALGPLLIADETHAQSTSYGPILWIFAAISAVFALAALFTPVPNAGAGDWNVNPATETLLAPTES